MKELADPRLGDEYDIVDMKRAIATATTCLHHMPKLRPNMTRVSNSTHLITYFSVNEED